MGSANSSRQVAVATKFYTVASDIFGSLVWGVFHVTILAPRILRWPSHILRICVPLTYINLWNLTFIYPCILSISLKYNQQDATFSRSIYFYKFLYMFQTVPPPIVRST